MAVIPMQPEQTEMFWYTLRFTPQILCNCVRIWEAQGGVFSFRPVLTEQHPPEEHQEENVVAMLHGERFVADDLVSTLYIWALLSCFYVLSS